jgi:glycosyltransferase involved in cell wall biosynthesis
VLMNPMAFHARRQILVNTRVLSAPVTGIQRCTKELLARWNGDTDTISPSSYARGVLGHAWEQLVLPAKLGKRLLFSPSNSGPLKENQVVMIHDMAAFDSPETFSPQFAAWYQFLLPRLARQVRRIVTPSEFVKERIVVHTKVDQSKIVVIPNAVTAEFCPQAVSGLERAVAVLKLPSPQYILAVGSMEKRKNLPRLLQAWARVQRQVPEDLWLVIVGAKGNSRVFARESLNDLPARVFLAGHVEESLLPSLFAGALLLTYVSYYEGFGLPPLEAMASGTPVLVGNCSSLPEVVGDAGMLVNPFSVDEIAEAIYDMVRDPALRADLRSRGLLRAKQFSWDETARRTWEVLQSVTNRESRSSVA